MNLNRKIKPGGIEYPKYPREAPFKIPINHEGTDSGNGTIWLNTPRAETEVKRPIIKNALITHLSGTHDGKWREKKRLRG